MKTLVVVFKPSSAADYNDRSRQYHYLYLGQKTVKRGDFAVVMTDSGPYTVRIERVKLGLDDKVTKHVISIINAEDIKWYEEANRGIEEQRMLIEELDQRLQHAKRLDRYEDLAAKDPKARALLDQIRGYCSTSLEDRTVDSVNKKETTQETTADAVS